MHDRLYILRNGQVHEGRRYLRKAGGRTYQTVFYLRQTRCDPAGYARFATDDPAMNAAAEGMLAAMVDEAVRVVEEAPWRHGAGGNGRAH
jgi:hypothetical protein